MFMHRVIHRFGGWIGSCIWLWRSTDACKDAILTNPRLGRSLVGGRLARAAATFRDGEMAFLENRPARADITLNDTTAAPADRPHLAQGSVRQPWLVFDVKYDGFRARCYVEQGRCRRAATKGRNTGRCWPRWSRPASCTASIRRPPWPTCWPGSSTAGPTQGSPNPRLGAWTTLFSMLSDCARRDRPPAVLWLASANPRTRLRRLCPIMA